MQDIEKKIEDLQNQINSLNDAHSLIDHEHNGYDISRVKYINIEDKKIFVNHTLHGALSATATNYGVFWIAPMKCVVTEFSEVHEVAGSDGSAVTLNLEKLTSGVAPGSGSEILPSPVSLKATANIVQNGVITRVTSNRTLKKGDRLCLKDTGTLTSVSNVTIKVKLKVI